MSKLLKQSTFTVLNYSEHHFDPEGWTALWLLGESHLAVHTFPEHGKSYVELSSCMFDKFCSFCQHFDAMLELTFIDEFWYLSYID